jgi:DNA-binding PadR family transcriptional regulator
VGELEADGTAEESRKLYRLTKAGAAVLADELKRLDQVVRAGRRRLAAGRVREV